MHKTLYSRGQKVLLQLLAETRNTAGLTQAELGKRMKEDQTWVSKVETGIRRIDLVELALWCRAVDLPLVKFIKLYDERVEDSLGESMHRK